MKKVTLALLALFMIVATPMVVLADGHEKEEAKEVTVKGEPVDIKCYLGGQSGPKHASCATACANNGLPIGLLVTKNGKKHLLLTIGGDGKPAKDHLAKHMGKTVSVTGKVTTKDGMNVITVAKVEAVDKE